MTARDLPSVRLSVAMIVRNCAAELRQSIQTVCDLADEIVVLDTGSTDETPAVAAALGAKCLHRPWDDDFSVARNACLAGARGEWVLWLDAGEQLPPESQAALSRALHEPLDPTCAFWLPVVLPSKSGAAAAEQIVQTRLHTRRSGLAFAGRVRESLDNSLQSAGLQAQILDLPVHRSQRHHEPAVQVARAQRNMRLADLSMAEQGPSAAMHNCLGEALHALAMPTQASEHYRRALELATAGSAEQLESYYGLLSCLDVAPAASGATQREAQLALCMQALEQFPLDAQLLVALGIYLRSLGQLPLAARALETAFRHGQVQPRLWHLVEVREIAASAAASIHEECGEFEAGKSLLEAGIRLFPQSERLLAHWERRSTEGQTLRADAAQTRHPAAMVSRETPLGLKFAK